MNEVIIWLGVKPISGCLGCGACIRRGPNGEKPSGRCFMDRAFYGKGKTYRYKPAAQMHRSRPRSRHP